MNNTVPPPVMKPANPDSADTDQRSGSNDPEAARSR